MFLPILTVILEVAALQRTLVETALDEEVGRRYNAAIAKIAAAENCTPLIMAARIDRDSFFQECAKMKEDPAKVLMAYYAKHLESLKQQQESQQGELPGPMDAQVTSVGKRSKKTEEETDRMNRFLDRADKDFRVRVGDMKRARNRQKKVNEARMKKVTSGDGEQENDVEEDMRRLMDEGERLLKSM